MQAREIVMTAVGEPEDLRLRTRELPAPAEGQVLVRVEASGVSFAEQQMRRGKYFAQPEFPFVPGYDLVGTVVSAGGGFATGQRVAALTQTGGWADHVLLDATDLMPVPDGLAPADVETLIVNGITAWRMLHLTATVRAGRTVVVLGATGGVGSTLVQLARLAGIRVIGTASARNQDALRALGAEPVDYRGDVPAQVAALAPEGVAAVFDHIGGPGIADSWRMLAPGGTLVAYGTAATRDDPGNPQVPVLKLIARLALWNLLPNGRHAYFFNLWSGKSLRPNRFRARNREHLDAVLQVLARGGIRPQVAATYGLEQAAEAMRFAESGRATGKVVIVPSEDRAQDGGAHSPGDDHHDERRTTP